MITILPFCSKNMRYEKGKKSKYYYCAQIRRISTQFRRISIIFGQDKISVNRSIDNSDWLLKFTHFSIPEYLNIERNYPNFSIFKKRNSSESIFWIPNERQRSTGTVLIRSERWRGYFYYNFSSEISRFFRKNIRNDESMSRSIKKTSDWSVGRGCQSQFSVCTRTARIERVRFYWNGYTVTKQLFVLKYWS